MPKYLAKHLKNIDNNVKECTLMCKKSTSLALAIVMCLSLCVPAFAAEVSKTEPKSSANVKAETQQEALLFDQDVYDQVLLSETSVFENGVLVGTLRRYQFTPNFDTYGTMTTSTYMVEYLPSNGGYVRLYGYFMYDGQSVTCYDTSVTYDIANYSQKSFDITGNGTSKSTIKLSFSFSSWGGASNQGLTLWCDKNGNTNA